MAKGLQTTVSKWVSEGYRERLLILLDWDDQWHGTREQIINELTSVLFLTSTLPSSEKARAIFLFSSEMFQRWLSTTTNSVDAVLTFNSNEGMTAWYETSPTSLACAIIDLHLSKAGYFIMTWYTHQVSHGTVFDMMCRFCAALICEFFGGNRNLDLEFIKLSGLYDMLEAALFTEYPTYEMFDAICGLWESLMSRLPHNAKVIILIDGIDTFEHQSESEMERCKAAVNLFVHTVKTKRGIRRYKVEGYPEALPRVDKNGRVFSSKSKRTVYSTSNREFKLLVTAHNCANKGHNWYRKPCRLDHPSGPTSLRDVPADIRDDPDKVFQKVAGSVLGS